MTATLSDNAGFYYDSGYMTATVTNGAHVSDQDMSAWGYVNTQPLARYEVAELDEDALAAYTPKNVTVTPQEDGLIVECDYEPDARTININVDVLLSDGSAARVISDTSYSSKDQVMKLEGDRQSFFIAARHLSDEEEQQISEDGAQKVINGYKGGDRLFVTMNFEVGRYSQATPWSAPPVTFTYGSGAIGATFAQDDNVTVARNFLPEIATITVTSPLEVTYNGEWQTLDYTVTLNGSDTVLTPGVDYTEEYINNYRPGEATLAVIGQGAYSGRMTQSFTINGIDLASEAVTATLAFDSTVYNGSSQAPAVLVAYDGRIMEEGSEYYTEYSDNVNAGTATAVLTGTGNFTGTLELPFTVNPLSLDDLDSASVANAVYSTAPQTPKITMYTQYRDGDGYSQSNYLTADRDYDILGWADNVNAGSASLTVKGKGNYTGQRVIAFTINPMPLQRNDFTVTGTATKVGEDGAELHDLAVVWKRTGQALRQGTDFTVENLYPDSNDAYFYLRGLGNFGGSTGTYSFRLQETVDVTLPIMGSFPAGWMIDKDGVLTIQALGALNSISYNDQQRPRDRVGKGTVFLGFPRLA